jgi:hypothetical protein
VRARLAPVVILIGIVACSRNPTEPSEPDPFDPPGLPTAADVDVCVSETNRYRASLGRAAVTNPRDFQERAQAGADSDHASGQPHGYFQSHPVPAENEALRWPLINGQVRLTITAMIDMFFAEGPGGGHFENLRGPYGEIGCGLAVSGSRMTMVLIFR